MKNQMKMIAYAVEPEELPVFEKYYQNYNIDLKLLSEKPTLKNTAVVPSLIQQHLSKHLKAAILQEQVLM